MGGAAASCLEVKQLMLIFCIAGAAAMSVVAYSRLRARSPEAASAAVGAVKQLAAVVLVCARAVEGVVEALQSPVRRRPAYVTPGRPWQSDYYDFEEDE